MSLRRRSFVTSPVAMQGTLPNSVLLIAACSTPSGRMRGWITAGSGFVAAVGLERGAADTIFPGSGFWPFGSRRLVDWMSVPMWGAEHCGLSAYAQKQLNAVQRPAWFDWAQVLSYVVKVGPLLIWPNR